jgi:hypothetical protein
MVPLLLAENPLRALKSRAWIRAYGPLERQYTDLAKNPRAYCPNHATGVTFPDDFVVTPQQYVD